MQEVFGNEATLLWVLCQEATKKINNSLPMKTHQFDK